MLNRLAYETVAQIVDLALLVKRDATGHTSDLSRFRTPTALNPDYPCVFIHQVGLLHCTILALIYENTNPFINVTFIFSMNQGPVADLLRWRANTATQLHKIEHEKYSNHLFAHCYCH